MMNGVEFKQKIKLPGIQRNMKYIRKEAHIKKIEKWSI
jgi:hypothetical protein